MDFSTLFIGVPYAQQQNGVSDCELFVIAFAVHLALGDDGRGDVCIKVPKISLSYSWEGFMQALP